MTAGPLQQLPPSKRVFQQHLFREGQLEYGCGGSMSASQAMNFVHTKEERMQSSCCREISKR
ncbi:uncharacterized protein PHALS_06243 [Plasmopara halstedii]|uniref:Uncharacterized protein n=1 Tax=Plasmopara halstedii TaxID=4781 RepID=A0A0N7L7Z1_PLAHL|nr:uncharacterized protein PHALS_06243 [Plasmopara halstedii]CEG48419.1 hypothetical protein PHALS_06243 [Plasmopara halstedii]|eukprot:XP_024584788.1 hypothetical protein PHALS_06243 [Plasmopara halstedii]